MVGPKLTPPARLTERDSAPPKTKEIQAQEKARAFHTGPGDSIAAGSAGFADFEHLGAADRAGTLGGRSSVLHRDLLGVLHITLGLTLHAVSFHGGPS